MQLDNPVFVPNDTLPETGSEGQLAFLQDVGMHQFVGGVKVIPQYISATPGQKYVVKAE